MSSVDAKQRNAFPVWVAVVFVAYVAMAAFQKYAIYPVEAKLLPLYSQYASLMYLPHAVRVLATTIYGSKTFFVLLPAILFETFLFYPMTDGLLSLTTLSIAIIGAVCAPVAFILIKLIGGALVPGFDAARAAFNWRYVFVGGIIASAINSIGLTAFFFDLSDFAAASLAMARFFLGDSIGLLASLIMLTFVFRILRGLKEA